MRLFVSPTARLLACAALFACGGDGGSTDPGQRLVAVGRLERGSTVRLVARDGVSAADSLVSTVTVTPAAAGAVSGTSVRLLQSGSVSVSARTSDGRTVTAVLDVAVPPTVFFDAVAAGNRDIYSVALDGADLKRWTTATAEDSHPSVAAATLVFSSARDGNGELYSTPTTAAGAEQRLTTTAGNETQPTLVNGAARVAFVSDAGGAPRVYVAPLSLVGPARLSPAGFGFGGSLESDPTWSPTGDRIAFMATANGRANLFLAPSTAGSLPAAVAGSGAGQTDVEPAWSPDGNRIAFASTRAGSTQIFLLDLRTGAFSQVTQGASPSGQPGWLPDGRLVFTVFAGAESTLWWVDPSDVLPPVEIPTGTRLALHATGVR
jgi:dipeptidyl aminopeptidase/acylaminoacyl peptidase